MCGGESKWIKLTVPVQNKLGSTLDLSEHLIPSCSLRGRRPLGSGSFGHVYRAFWHGAAVAVKEVVVQSRRDELRLKREVQ